MLKNTIISGVVLWMSSVALGGEACRTVEDRWNTSLLRTISIDETFINFDKEANAIESFIWVRCEEGRIVGGSHPTFRGGDASAYAIVNRVLATVNSDLQSGDKEISLDDLKIDCR
jgi:hypothetical protein